MLIRAERGRACRRQARARRPTQWHAARRTLLRLLPIARRPSPSFRCTRTPRSPPRSLPRAAGPRPTSSSSSSPGPSPPAYPYFTSTPGFPLPRLFLAAKNLIFAQSCDLYLWCVLPGALLLIAASLCFLGKVISSKSSFGSGSLPAHQVRSSSLHVHMCLFGSLFCSPTVC